MKSIFLFLPFFKHTLVTTDTLYSLSRETESKLPPGKAQQAIRLRIYSTGKDNETPDKQRKRKIFSLQTVNEADQFSSLHRSRLLISPNFFLHPEKKRKLLRVRWRCVCRAAQYLSPNDSHFVRKFRPLTVHTRHFRSIFFYAGLVIKV